MRRKLTLLLLIILPSTLLVGCATQYDEAFFEEAKNKFTPEESLAAYYYSLLLLFAFQDDKGMWHADYRALTNRDVLATVNSMLSDIDNILKSKFWLRLVRRLELEQPLLRKEAILRYIRERLAFRELMIKFYKLIGEAVPELKLETNNPAYLNGGGSYKPTLKSTLREEGSEKFDPLILWPTVDLRKFKFVPTYISEAKREGKLYKLGDLFLFDEEKEVKSLYEIAKNQTPSEKLEKVREGYLIRAFKVIDPEIPNKKQVADVIEVFRVFEIKLDQETLIYQREPQPFMIGYRGLKSRSVNVWVIDIDRPEETGYGIPNEVVTQVNIKVPRDLITKEVQYAFLIKYSRYEKPKEKREIPEETEIKLEIVRAGGIKVDPWEYSEEGFKVPFVYKEKEQEEWKFRVGVKLEEGKILYVEKIWYRKGVREKFNLKEEFAQKEYLDAKVTNKILTLHPKGEFSIEGHVDLFIKPLPFEITYEVENNLVIIRDENEDGIFEKRRVIAK